MSKSIHCGGCFYFFVKNQGVNKMNNDTSIIELFLFLLGVIYFSFTFTRWMHEMMDVINL
jgi:hypothetical protein